MRSRRAAVRVLAMGVLVPVALLTQISTAYAKEIPLETQVTDGDRTVRVPPDEFIKRIYVPGVRGHWGAFEYAPKPRRVTGRPLDISLIVYASRSDPGGVHETMNRDVRREAMVAFEYFRHRSGAVGRIRAGGAEAYRPGQWVRLTPAFVALVEDAVKNSPSVAPVSAPPRRSSADREPVLDGFLVPVLAAGLAMAIAVLALALHLSRRAARQQRALDRSNSQVPDRVAAG